jgi:hypothetical protein
VFAVRIGKERSDAEAERVIERVRHAGLVKATKRNPDFRFTSDQWTDFAATDDLQLAMTVVLPAGGADDNEWSGHERFCGNQRAR